MIIFVNPTFSLNPLSLTRSPSKTAHKIHSSLIGSIISMTHKPRRRCDYYDLHKELIPYVEAWTWQKAIVKERKSLSEKLEDSSDTLIILQHQPVYTLGTGSSEGYLNFDVKNAPFDLYRTERGGEVTYHGPGQMDLHWYLRALEEVVIRVLSATFSMDASRVDGLTGVWVGHQKLAAIGIKVSQWITFHGLALNVTTDIAPFNQIVPCGIRDRKVGSIKGLLRENLSSNRHRAANNDHTDDCKLIDMAYGSLIREFCDVFQLDLQPKFASFKGFHGS